MNKIVNTVFVKVLRLSPEKKFFYTKCGFYGFSVGLGIISFMAFFEVQAKDRKISFFRSLTKTGAEGRSAVDTKVVLSAIVN